MVKEYLSILKEQGKYKIGIEKSYYISKMESSGLNPVHYCAAVFKNPDEKFLIIKESIISLKTLNITSI